MAAATNTLHIAMYPWLALGHLTAFIHLANKLAGKGNKISFIIPTKTNSKLEHFNLHPDLITFIPITIPHVQGLPPGAETTSDVPLPLHSHIMTAMDNTEPNIELLLRDLKPDIVFFDFTHWLPSLARRLGIKSVYYCCISPATTGYTTSPARLAENEPDMKQPPQGYPVSSINLHAHEARAFAARRTMKFGSNTLFYDRIFTSLSQCDAMAYRACRETEGPFIDYLETQFGKLVLPSGPVIPVSPTSSLEEKWANWLGGFKSGSVIYCAFGSECTLNKDQFQELLLGFDLTGMPFFAALKPPTGAETIEAALPEGFENRIAGRGIVHGGWVQQQLILEHPTVGCFVTHCGSGSLSEALVNKCQLVLLPQVADQIINARMMSSNLKVGVEVEKGEEDGLFSKQSVCDAVRSVMEEDSEVGREVRENHGRLRELLLRNDLESSYIEAFNQKLHDILG